MADIPDGYTRHGAAPDADGRCVAGRDGGTGEPMCDLPADHPVHDNGLPRTLAELGDAIERQRR